MSIKVHQEGGDKRAHDPYDMMASVGRMHCVNRLTNNLLGNRLCPNVSENVNPNISVNSFI